MSEQATQSPKCELHPHAEPKYVPINAGQGELRCPECNRLVWTTKHGVIKQAKPKVSAMLPPNPVRDFDSPNIHKVATNIKADDPKFIPQYDEGMNFVGLLSNNDTVRLQHRGTAEIDCGVTIELPVGYKAVVHPEPSLANKGLLLGTSTVSGRVRVVVLNVGKEILVINHGDRIAQMAVEPVHIFDWMMVEKNG